MTRGHIVFNCKCGRNAPFLDKALSQFRLAVHFEFFILFLRGNKASEKPRARTTILNVREVTRGGRIGDFFPSCNSVTFLMGRVGGGRFLQALAFLLALTDKNDNNKAPLSLSGKIRIY